MKNYAVWSEGFRATGGSGQPFYHGIMEATSFKDACRKAFENVTAYNLARNTYWGCRLFDNEADAQSASG